MRGGAYALLVAAAGCGTLARARPATEPLLPLALDESVRGDTHDDDGWHLAICTGGGIAGKKSARAYRFVAPETASYRVEVAAEYPAVVEVSIHSDRRRETIACFGVGEGRRGGWSVPMRAGSAYAVIVDGVMQARGAYDLVVKKDGGPKAPIRPEDPAVTGPACAAARALATGGEDAGTFTSVPGGLRASCGGTGSRVAYRLDASSPTRLEVAAHFTPILEVRPSCDAPPVACAAAPDGRFHVALTTPLPPGRYVVFVDTTDVVTKPPDDRPGAGVLGAYWLRAAETEP